MKLTFFDREDEANKLQGTVVQDGASLLRIFDAVRNRWPFICELVGQNGFRLHVGVGANGFVQYSSCDGSPPYLVALAPRPEQRDKEIEFLCGGTPTPIPDRNCMPFESVREIAGYFLQTGRAHPAFSWEEV